MNAITPITEARLLQLAPSVFAAGAHESRSTRYGFFNSIALIRALVEKGFDVTDARQSNARDPGKKDFTKHVVRLRHAASFAATTAAFVAGKAEYADTHTEEARAAARAIQGYGEVVLTNSHDGSSAVVLHGGILRPDCFNGLYVSDAMIASIHVTHSKRLVENVIDGAFTVVEQLPKAIAAIGDWRQIELTAPEQLAFAEAAHELRFERGEDGKPLTAVEPQQLLGVRRDADVGSDLWRVFNTVQENSIRGGLRDTRPGHRLDNGQWKPTRRLKTRPIGAIDGDVKLNKALWSLAERMAELKVAA